MHALIPATHRYTTKIDPVWLFLAVALFALFLVDVDQALASLRFSGITPADAPGFIVAQLLGGVAAVAVFAWLLSPVTGPGQSISKTLKQKRKSFGISTRYPPCLVQLGLPVMLFSRLGAIGL